MSKNKATVERYIDGFNRTDHEYILSCLTDDVEWVLPGLFHARGKEEFDSQIENEDFVDSPTIVLSRMTEEDDIVIAEGSVKCAFASGGILNAVFCDVFEMRDGKITKLTSYLAVLK
ncbi:MAG: nuclear transport factor 2 family protein [Acidobacteriota bacterium]